MAAPYFYLIVRIKGQLVCNFVITVLHLNTKFYTFIKMFEENVNEEELIRRALASTVSSSSEGELFENVAPCKVKCGSHYDKSLDKLMKLSNNDDNCTCSSDSDEDEEPNDAVKIRQRRFDRERKRQQLERQSSKAKDCLRRKQKLKYKEKKIEVESAIRPLQHDINKKNAQHLSYEQKLRKSLKEKEYKQRRREQMNG